MTINASPSRSPGGSPEKKRSTLRNFARQSTISSKNSKSRISESVGLSRRAQLRSLWTHNDFTVCNIIAQMAQTRMQIFTNHITTKHKSRMKSKVIKFVSEFIMTKTFKSMARMVKDDLPKLLGYEHTEMFLFDNVKNNLYCMSIDG
jgi:hypothetical protein